MKDVAPLEQNSEISRRLRTLYESAQEEDIPVRFLDLLEKLDAAEKASSGGSHDE